MRAAPVGAYFADDVEKIITESRKSAEVTHAHPEGQAGAIAVALASGWMVRNSHSITDQRIGDCVNNQADGDGQPSQRAG